MAVLSGSLVPGSLLKRNPTSFIIVGIEGFSAAKASESSINFGTRKNSSHL